MTTINEHKELQTVTFASAGNYDRDAFGELVRKVNLKLDGTASTTSAVAGTLKGDAAYRLFGAKIVVQQDSEDILNCSPIDLRHLSARLESGYLKTKNVAPSTGANNQLTLAQIPLDMRRLMRGSGLDARRDRATFRGTFGTPTLDFATGDANLTFAGTLRFLPEAIPDDQPELLWRPAWTQAEKEIFPGSSDVRPDVLRFTRPQALPCLAFRVVDANLDDRSDGLLRKLTVRLTRVGRSGRDLFKGPWGMLRSIDAQASGFGEDDYDASVGWALLRLFDPTQRETGGVPIMNVGDTIELIYDSTTTVEGEFASVTPAVGDKVIMTKLAFDRVRDNRVITATDQLGLGVRGGRPQRGVRAGARRA